MQDQARVVVIGAGIVGCSVAYHLTQRGFGDVLRWQLNSNRARWPAAVAIDAVRPAAEVAGAFRGSPRAPTCPALPARSSSGCSWR